MRPAICVELYHSLMFWYIRTECSQLVWISPMKATSLSNSIDFLTDCQYKNEPYWLFMNRVKLNHYPDPVQVCYNFNFRGISYIFLFCYGSQVCISKSLPDPSILTRRSLVFSFASLMIPYYTCFIAMTSHECYGVSQSPATRFCVQFLVQTNENKHTDMHYKPFVMVMH